MISSTTRTAGPYAGTGSQAAFSFGFKVFQASDLLVVLTDASGNNTTLALTSQYTVNLNANQDSAPGGTITLVTAPPVGYKVTMSSQVAALQNTNLTNAGNFYPTTLNNSLDYLTILIQQLQVALNNCLQVSIGAGGVSTVLPNPQAGLGLGWNPAGSGLINIDFAGAAAASATSAANSATVSANSASASANSAAALDFANTQLASGIVTFNNFDMGFVSTTPSGSVIDLGTVH